MCWVEVVYQYYKDHGIRSCFKLQSCWCLFTLLL